MRNTDDWRERGWGSREALEECVRGTYADAIADGDFGFAEHVAQRYFSGV